MFTHTFNSQDFFVNLLVHDHHDLSSPLTNLPIYEIEPGENVLRLDENGKWEIFNPTTTTEQARDDRVLLDFCSASFNSATARGLIENLFPYIALVPISKFEDYCKQNDMNEKNYFMKALGANFETNSERAKLSNQIDALPFVNKNPRLAFRFDNEMPFKNVVYLFPEPEDLGVWITDNNKGFGGMFQFKRAVGVIL